MTTTTSSREQELLNGEDKLDDRELEKPHYQWEIEFRDGRFIILLLLHIAGVYGAFTLFQAHWATLVFAWLYLVWGLVSLTGGCHRLWSHHAYEAALPLRIFLMLGISTACQINILSWARTHRQHHKFSDTDADPHNSRQGFFFSHIGWTFLKPHPEAYRARKQVNVEDLKKDRVVMFQWRYLAPVTILVAFVIPITIPFLWGEGFLLSWNVNVFRICVLYHCTFVVNSVTHMFGYKPYDKNVVAVQNKFVSFTSVGEGFHNFHHAFPWDYRTGELGDNWLNFTTFCIDLFATLGLVTGRKTVSQDIITKRALRTGDGSYEYLSKY